MKKAFTIALSALVLAAALSGCGGTDNTEKYFIYTNIAVGGFETNSKIGSQKGFSENLFSVNLLSGGTFGGVKSEKAENTKGFTTKSKDWQGIINTDLTANLYISENFENSETSERFNSLCAEIQTVIDDINYSLSATIESSCIYAFNNATAGEKVEITKTAHTVLNIAKSAYEFTGGYYNPAVYCNVQAYGFGGEKSYPSTAEGLPQDEVIEKYNVLSSAFEKLELVEENGAYYAFKPDITVEIDGKTCSMKLDLGGIGKGYATDVISGLIDKYGFKFGHFDFGGSSNVYKSHFSAGNYILGITDPRSIFGLPYMTVPIANESISTSGDNAQYYVIDGIRYCHVINPVTGKPVQTGVCSATVLGGSAAESDAYTTAIMAMGKDKAVEFIQNKLTNRRVVFTYDAASDIGKDITVK